MERPITAEELNHQRQQPTATMPGGYLVADPGTIVIIGPNGSGKTKLSRQIVSSTTFEVVNALRNTRISPELQAMALNHATANFQSQREQARAQPNELSNDFDFLLTKLYAEFFNSSTHYLQDSRDGKEPQLPTPTTLERVRAIWAKFFPGRVLGFRDYAPYVQNSVSGDAPAIEYSAFGMSDGEKAALYLAARILNAERDAVVLVDEPETHFHSLLAVDFWNAIEAERPDLRIIYVTHDMPFAASRRNAHLFVASPNAGLQHAGVIEELPDDVAAVLLGTATLSFFARRIVFCEGEEGSYDKELYEAWLSDPNTVFRAVGSADMVIRCVTAIRGSSLIRNLEVTGLIDRDFHTDAYLEALPEGVKVIGVHEVESLFALPGVVTAVGEHIGTVVDPGEFGPKLVATYQDHERHKVILERWKRRVEARIIGIVASVRVKTSSISDIIADMPTTFDHQRWEETPQQSLELERARIESAVNPATPDVDTALKLMPGKQLVPEAAKEVGLHPVAYRRLVIGALRGGNDQQQELGTKVRAALAPYVPL